MGVMTSITYLASILLIVGVVYEHGFTISEVEAHQLQRLYHGVWIVFLVDVTLRILLEYKDTRRTFSKLTWILTILLYLTLIPVIFHRPEEEGAILQFWEFLHGKAYHLVLLLVFSFFSLSNGLVRLLGRRTNPSLILAASFLIIIMIGTGLLMLPRCTTNGISWVDSLFISTSAVCVTGLTSVDVASTFTPTGFVVIILLIQIGGLGVMTLTSFFAMFFMGNTSLYNQLVVRDMVSSNSLNSLLSTLVYILAFTLVIEGIGMLAIWGDIHGTMGMDLQEELAFSAFHAISAFCNAGFSTLPGNLGNPLVMTGHNPFFIYISLLIILGGIGFPILVNFLERILTPEEDAARGLVQLLEFGADMETFRVAPDYYVVKFTVPDKFIGYYANELNLDKEFGLKMLALKRAETLKNCLGVSYVEHNVLNELPENDQIQAGDQLVCYGRYKDFQKFWKAL